jgi:hypothetical protein
MASFINTYAKEISKQLDFLITWPISTNVKLGDVGILEDEVFKRTDTLDNLGIAKPRVRNGLGEDIVNEYTSKNGIEITVDPNMEGKLNGVGGKIDIKFNREGAVFLRLYNHVLKQFESTDQLGKDIIQRFINGNWQKNRVIVTEIISCSNATVLVAGSNNAKASLQLDVSLPVTEALAKGKFAQSIGFTGSFGAKIIGANVSPLIRICGIKPKWFGYGNTDFRSKKDILNNDVPDSIEFSKIHSSNDLIDF